MRGTRKNGTGNRPDTTKDQDVRGACLKLTTPSNVNLYNIGPQGPFFREKNQGENIMRYIITAKHVNGHEMKQTRYSKEDVERTINLMKQCGYIEITVQERC